MRECMVAFLVLLAHTTCEVTNCCVDCFFIESTLKLVTTQLPFPLVQMGRTFLLFYIFTLPFALLSDISSPYVHLLVIFFVTYGFVGLEIVAVELDDPFGGTLVTIEYWQRLSCLIVRVGAPVLADFCG